MLKSKYKKISLIMWICLFFINLTYSNLNTATYDWNQPDYCATLAKSDATKYDFYKCAYFEKIREENNIHIPTQAELEVERLKQYDERERIRNDLIIENTNREIEEKWNNLIWNFEDEYNKIDTVNSLNVKSIEFIQKKDYLNAIYTLKQSLSIDYRNEVNDLLDTTYLSLSNDYNDKFDYNNAIKYALLSENKELVNNILSNSYIWLAGDYYSQLNYEKSIEYALLSINHWYNKKWYSYYIIWLSSYWLEKYTESLYYYNLALKYKDDTTNEDYIGEQIKLAANMILKEDDSLIDSLVSNNCWIKSIENNSWNCICENWYIWEYPNDSENFDCKKIEKVVSNINLSLWDYLSSEWIIKKQESENLYRLDDYVLRQEVIWMAIKLWWLILADDYKCKNYYTDVSSITPNTWACRAIEISADNWIITKSNSTFRPEDKITKVEALSILLKWANINIDSFTASNFIDVSVPWQINVVNTAMSKKIVDQWSYFFPNQNATRWEIFEMVKRIILSK